MNDTAEKLQEDFSEDQIVDSKQEDNLNEEDFDVEIVDDTPEEDRVPKRNVDTIPSDSLKESGI